MFQMQPSSSIETPSFGPLGKHLEDAGGNLDGNNSSSDDIRYQHDVTCDKTLVAKNESLSGQNGFNKELHQQQQSLTSESNFPTPSPPSFTKSTSLNQQQISDSSTSPQDSIDRSNGCFVNNSTRHKHWSNEEDKTLKLAVKKEQNDHKMDWRIISEKYFGNKRSAIQCKNRWKNVSKTWRACRVFHFYGLNLRS